MNAIIRQSPPPTAERLEELGRIIMAYSEVTEKLQQSHDQLQRTVQALRNELGEKNRLLERRDRLAALGEMAAGMAHEIRNPLGGIQLYASMLSRDVADRPDSLQLVQKIAGGVRRLETLVSQVLQFTREMQITTGPMDLAATVDQAVELASEQMRRAGVTCRIDGMRPMNVSADAMLVGQALLNLVLNAVEAMEGGGMLSIRFRRPPADSEARQFNLVVRDSGPGVPPQIMERVFNPFFTTKETGTGLGLAIVHRIVEAHEGTIRVSNGEGGGAEFEIRI